MGQTLRNVGPCSDLGLKCLKLGDYILTSKGILGKFTYIVTSWYLFYEPIICMSEYWLKETLMTIPECQHYFIVEWHSLNATYPISWNSTKQFKPMDIS